MTPTLTIPAYPPSPLPATLRTATTTALLSASAIPTLHTTLTSACQETHWLDAVRERSLQLLRGGECATYAEVMGRVLREARGVGGMVNGDGDGGGREGGIERRVDVRVPERVVREGVRVVREALERVVVVEREEEE